MAGKDTGTPALRLLPADFFSARTACLAAFFVWFNIVLALILKHEYWRDEVRSYILAIESPSIWRLISHVYNDGHPALWNAILWGYNWFFHDGIVITLAGLTIGTLATGLFLFRAPFHPLVKIIFIFGALPLYEYTVMSRNYGLAMLLLFSYASLPGCLRNMLLDGLLPAMLLFLLANTNLIGLIVVLALLPVLLLELVRHVRLGSLRPRHVTGLVIVLCGIAISLYTLLPTSTSPQMNCWCCWWHGGIGVWASPPPWRCWPLCSPLEPSILWSFVIRVLSLHLFSRRSG